jgi:hypothetical protein
LPGDHNVIGFNTASPLDVLTEVTQLVWRQFREQHASGVHSQAIAPRLAAPRFCRYKFVFHVRTPQRVCRCGDGQHRLAAASSSNW